MPHHSDLTHTPFDGSEPLFRIGLKPYAHENWLEPDHCFEDHLAEKRRLLETIPDKVFQDVGETQGAQGEVLAKVRSYMEKHHAERCSTDETGGPDLVKAALMVQEDLILMRRFEDGWRLVAACVCFPSSWSLQEKIGKPMHEVHAPVPGFNKGTRNAGMIERIFDNLQTDHPVERFNWSVYNSDALYHDSHSAEQSGGGERHFLRVERQTLTRLSGTGDILFTVRIHVDPFEALQGRADRAEIARGFIGLLQRLDGEQLAYKGLDEGRDILVSRLEKLVSGV